MKPNLDHLSAALRQVGVVVTATGLVTGVFNADQARSVWGSRWAV